MASIDEIMAKLEEFSKDIVEGYAEQLATAFAAVSDALGAFHCSGEISVDEYGYLQARVTHPALNGSSYHISSGEPETVLKTLKRFVERLHNPEGLLDIYEKRFIDPIVAWEKEHRESI